jgi:uncharacterized protein (TIGR03083 family)
MELSRRVELIATDSRALAAAGERDLTARITFCPDWSMADLVRHVLQVHRSWCRIVEQGLTEPDWSEDPLPGDGDLVAEFLGNAERFAEVLGRTDPEQPCWTWGPEQNAGFVQRFQVQEASLHRWDAQEALGPPDPIATDGAADSLVQLEGIMPLFAPDATAGYTLLATDAPVDVTLRPSDDAEIVGSLRGTASDLLLAYWQRIPVESLEVTGDAAAVTAAIAAADLD